MTTTTLTPGATSAPSLAIIDGRAMAHSRDVAQVFGKRHKDVLKAIKGLETPEEFRRRNFAPVKYRDAKGESRPAYNMTRDGFTLLAMGFTGKKVMQFKLAYIEAFNRMEAELQTPAAPPRT